LRWAAIILRLKQVDKDPSLRHNSKFSRNQTNLSLKVLQGIQASIISSLIGSLIFHWIGEKISSNLQESKSL
jgi:hypothetical protein